MDKILVQTGITFTYSVKMDDLTSGDVKIPDEIRAKAKIMLEAMQERFPSMGIRAEYWPMVTGNMEREEL